MEQFDSVTPDIGAPDGNNPFGTFLDEDAGIPGTPILAGWKTTIKAFFERFKTETNTTFNGNPDSAVVSQGFDMLMQLVSGLDPALAEWAAATFNQNDVTKYRGIQWFVGVASTVNTPGPNSEWVASPTLREAMNWATSKGPLRGGFLQANNIRDLTNYATHYKIAKYDWHGDKLEAWWLNIDGSAHVSGTSDVAKLLALSKFANEVILSDTAGTLTLKDYLGKVLRSADAVAGLTLDVGNERADEGQRITGEASKFVNRESATVDGVFSGSTILATGVNSEGATGDQISILNFDSANSVSPNAAKTNDDETHVAEVTEGAIGLCIIVPEGTI